LDKGKPKNEETFINGVWTISVGDSAEAWAKSIGKLMIGKHKAKKIVFDFSEIRGAGGRLKGYGWISSGDESVSKAYPAIVQIMNNRAGSMLRKVDIIEIMNHLGTVLSSRRSAEITFVDYGTDEWEEFAKLKRDCKEEGKKHKQQSNNSLVFNSKPTRSQMIEVFDMMIDAGGSEPGFYNMETGRKKAPFATGSNPCGEILLPSKGFCNLVEVDISKFKGNSAGLHQAYHIIARANYRQTCVDLDDGILSESWNTNNKFLRLCGVGATGIATRDDLTQYEIVQLNRSAGYAARAMAKELGTEYPKNVTTVKPSGTLGKIMDTTEGIHKPEAKYLFNWVNFSNHDPLIMKLKEANYRWIPNPGDSTSTLVCLPIKYDNVEFTKKEVTRKDGSVEVLEVNAENAITQLERYKKWQVYYCDQNVSNTIYYKPEERDEIIDWLLTNWDIYVGVSFLFKNDPTVSAKDLGFEYLPQEYVTKDLFFKYLNTLEEINWEDTDADIEIDDGGCASGICPVK
ncbi:MAG: ribonucleoside-triphosphate reductase, adenosylcobalamin-dependent, partial [Gammaproteobacteria bacterium]|nr:ribonucleoside-triphosphate reductase, adenosylcobalamin-dependent [Gammaproteobacteria bacterium]